VCRTLASFAAAVALSALAPAGAETSQQTASPAPTATCVFTNASYAGKCVEAAEVPSGSSAQQACESILRCLNDVGCAKTYCRATEIRSGWRLESATVK
jgi:hypothetical protein